MPGPPPPPPPPPLAPPPPPPAAPPSFGGGGGGGPAFLADIRKGAALRKVPESQKNDRSAALIGEVKSGSAAGKSQFDGRGAGPAPSADDIKSKLNAMFGGAAGLNSTVSPQAPSSAAYGPKSTTVPPAALTPHYPQAPYRPIKTPPPLPPSSSYRPTQNGPVIPVLPPARQQPDVRPYAKGPPPPPIRPPSHTVTCPVDPRRQDRVAPQVPTRQPSFNSSVASFDQRFTFPDASTFPPPPPAYTGQKTYVGFRPGSQRF